jgi:predicted ribosome quality control (RQC) complex YloA/Tae2 family protein
VNELTLKNINAELSSKLKGRLFGKIFLLSKSTLAIDFRLPEYLFVSLEPNSPRIYLFQRKIKELERKSINPSGFILLLRKKLSNATLQSLEKVANERILKFHFAVRNELGEIEKYTLVTQLTGRSANLILLDSNDFVIDSLRETEIATKYEIPHRETQPIRNDTPFPKGDFKTLSEALDVYYQQLEAERLFSQQAKSAQQKVKKEITKREKLIAKLNEDLKNHGDADSWKRLGDLLLSNLANAVRIDDTVLVVDYFDDETPTIEIEVDRNLSLTTASEKFFKRYTKARNAKEELTKRLESIDIEIQKLKNEQAELESAILEKNLGTFAPKEIVVATSKKKEPETVKYARKFVSTEGYEILVGKAAKDNDFLTFRVAKSFDLWLHAADYTGSHVIVRNPNKGEIPNQTLIEAARFAAFYSQAREQPKVAVHYTQKKFVNKPKGAVAGLASLSSFKTILVEPKIPAKA